MSETVARSAPTLPVPVDEAAPTPLWMPVLGAVCLVLCVVWLAWRLHDAGATEEEETAPAVLQAPPPSEPPGA